MYDREIKLINQHVVNSGPQGLVDVFSTVIATIRTRFSSVVSLSEDIRVNKHNAKALWSHKKNSYAGIVDAKEQLYSALVESKIPEKEAIEMLLKIKGLGIAKASFGLQMLGYNTACLDVHNLKKLGYSSSYFANSKRVEEYLKVVQEKGTEYWWNSWCELIPSTTANHKHFKTADEVSFTHTVAVRGY